MLAMTSAASDLENDLSQTFGPEEARAIALGDTPRAACRWQFGANLPLSP
jgi:hypothetical protein